MPYSIEGPRVRHPTDSSLFSALDVSSRDTELQPPSVGRRRLLQTGALLAGSWAMQNIDQAERMVKTLRLAWYLATDPSFKNLAFPPSIEHTLSTQQPTRYDDMSLQQTHIITFGDSIARGEVDGESDAAPAGFIVGKMNRFLAKDSWKWQNEAWNGATTDNVVTQIRNVHIRQPHVPTDVLLSVGGNDTLMFVNTPETLEKIDQLLADPSDPKLLRLLAQRVGQFLSVYKHDFHEVLTAMEARFEKDVAMQRLYVHGIPDMGNAKHIVLPTGKKLPLDGDIRTIAHHVSKLLNYTVLSAIHETDAPFDIVFVDNSLLQPEHFSDMHPNRAGYELIANQQMKQGVVVFPQGKKSLYELAA